MQLRSVLPANSLVRGSHSPPLTEPEHSRYFSPSTPLSMFKLMFGVYHSGWGAVNVKTTKIEVLFFGSFSGEQAKVTKMCKGACHHMGNRRPCRAYRSAGAGFGHQMDARDDQKGAGQCGGGKRLLQKKDAGKGGVGIEDAVTLRVKIDGLRSGQPRQSGRMSAAQRKSLPPGEQQEIHPQNASKNCTASRTFPAETIPSMKRKRPCAPAAWRWP